MQATIKKTGMSERKQWAIAIGIALVMQHFGVMASDMGDPLCNVTNLLTGKTMLGVMFFAVIGGGMGVFFGGEMTDFLKIIAKLILVVGIILGFGQIGSLVWTAAGKGAVTC